jgi:hypothetical protein
MLSGYRHYGYQVQQQRQQQQQQPQQSSRLLLE